MLSSNDDVETHTDQREQAFAGFVERNQKRAYWIALDLVKNPSEAEELSQEAFLMAYQKWFTLREEATRDGWFRKILINLCLNQRNRRSLWRRIEDRLRGESASKGHAQLGPVGLPTPEHALFAQATRGAIFAALEKLPEAQRRAFVLRFFHDLSLKEIAEATESAEGTIKSHLFRAVRTMRKKLAPLRDGA